MLKRIAGKLNRMGGTAAAMMPRRIEDFPRDLHLGCGGRRAPGFCNVDITAQSSVDIVDNVVTWAHMQKAYQDFVHCDTGTVGDLYTESLLRLMVEWKNVDQFAAMMQKDEQFKAFVLKHLKTATKDDQRDIRLRATQTCPKGMDAFCSGLVAAVNPGAEPPATAAAAPK